MTPEEKSIMMNAVAQQNAQHLNPNPQFLEQQQQQMQPNVTEEVQQKSKEMASRKGLASKRSSILERIEKLLMEIDEEVALGKAEDIEGEEGIGDESEYDYEDEEYEDEYEDEDEYEEDEGDEEELEYEEDEEELFA